MQKMIQIRNVPEKVHRTLKARAAMEGVSLSDYVLRQIEEIAERPTLKEMMERIASRPPVKLKVPPAKVIREMRDSR